MFLEKFLSSKKFMKHFKKFYSFKKFKKHSKKFFKLENNLEKLGKILELKKIY